LTNIGQFSLKLVGFIPAVMTREMPAPGALDSWRPLEILANIGQSRDEPFAQHYFPCCYSSTAVPKRGRP
jgi:hypothetical protein